MAPIDAEQVEKEESIQIANRQKEVLGEPGQPVLGVAFSGGGIRSATFNLGIVQGLAKSGLLSRVDYLSTVSGGGYVGTWLHGVIRRYAGGDPRNAELKSLLTRPESAPHNDPDEDPIAFLRNYSSYLAPEVGLFSADFWVIAGIWFRNILLNQMILIPFLVAVSLLPLFLGSMAGWYSNRVSTMFLGELALALIALAGVVWCGGKGVGAVALDGTGRHAWDTIRAGVTKRSSHTMWDSTRNAVVCSFLVLFSALGLALASDGLEAAQWLSFDRPDRAFVTIACLCIVIALMLAILQWQGRFSACFLNRHGKYPKFGPWGYPLLAGAATGVMIFGGMKALVLLDMKNNGVWHTVAWGPPLLSMAMLAGASLHIGLMGVDYEDNAREWLARLGAYIALLSLAWASLFVISVFGPYWFTALAVASWAPVAGIVGGWALTSIAGAMTGASSKTPATPGTRPSGGIRGLISAIAPAVFVVGYVLLLSLAMHVVVARLTGILVPLETRAPRDPVTIKVSAEASGAAGVRVDVNNTSPATPGFVIAAWKTEQALLARHDSIRPAMSSHDYMQQAGVIFGLLLGCAAIVWYLPRRIDVNEFSMHHFYKNRLVRCYLGATNGKNRRPSRVTGFDPRDDMPLTAFTAENSYFGPYPLINGCINLTRGAELAKSERRGSAFLFSPLYSGYDVPRTNADNEERARKKRTHADVLHRDGYRRTEGFGYPHGYMMGTCMGISGAAASPNGGYHTSPPMAFLMTVFCVRMGWWVGNTRKNRMSSRPGPTNSLFALLAELFASTDATSDFVDLSDGGHFENLGLYELVRRRCHFIIAGDGEQDGDYDFESLGGAVRKCRTDFGAEIEIDPRRIRPKDGASRTHCVVGKITYALRTGETARRIGWLLYLKSSLTGDEPEDVAQYKASHADFPQEPTSNQFFTESQFESYRKLGLHVWDSAFENVVFESGPIDLEHVFSSLYRNWYPPPDLPEGVASRHTDAYSTLLSRLSDPVFGLLRDQLIAPAGAPDFVAPEMPELSEEDLTKVFLYTLELIQLVENVWGDLRMTERAHRESPANAGWIRVFRYWARQPMFQHAWKQAGYSYNGLFQQFYNSLAECGSRSSS